jgi:hypothetical protein
MHTYFDIDQTLFDVSLGGGGERAKSFAKHYKNG